MREGLAIRALPIRTFNMSHRHAPFYLGMISAQTRYVFVASERKPVPTFRRSCLYTLDVFGAEQAIGFDHQDEDQHIERRDLVKIAPVQIFAVDILGDVFQEPDDDAAEHGAADRIETAQDRGGKDLDAVSREA